MQPRIMIGSAVCAIGISVVAVFAISTGHASPPASVLTSPALPPHVSRAPW